MDKNMLLHKIKRKVSKIKGINGYRVEYSQEELDIMVIINEIKLLSKSLRKQSTNCNTKML